MMNSENQTLDEETPNKETTTNLETKREILNGEANVVLKPSPARQAGDQQRNDALPPNSHPDVTGDVLGRNDCDIGDSKMLQHVTDKDQCANFEELVAETLPKESDVPLQEPLKFTEGGECIMPLQSERDEMITSSDAQTDHSRPLDIATPLQVVLPENLEKADSLGASPSAAGPSSASPPSPQLSVYHIKWIKWKDTKTAIITQNENGPCPLIAIMNVLILKGKVNLPPMIEMITAGQLMEYLGDCILDNAPKNISEGAQLNYEQNMHDAMAVLPKLQTGLDVNVKFTGVSDFEYTPECIIFDLLNIPLYHGWLVDPQMPLVVEAVGNSSYNQLVERIIRDKVSTDADVVVAALNAESFLERAASQLTYHGLCELNAAIHEDELCVLFRNNHFSTVYKYKNELFQLVTDQGFLTESSVVWETLSSIDGDAQFVDSQFAVVPPKSSACSASSVPTSSVQQIDQDYLVALSLQEEHRRQEEQEVAWQEYKEKQLGIVDTITDEELARRLQLEEQSQSQAQSQVPSQRGQPVSSCSTERHTEGKKKMDCSIL